MHTHCATHGPIFSVTTVVYGRRPVFTRPATIIPLYDNLHFYLPRRHVRLLGYVIMPDHLHLLLWPDDPAELGEFLRGVKAFTAKRIARQAEAEHDTALLAHLEAAGDTTGRCEHKLWQDGT